MCILSHRVFPRNVQLVWRYSAAVPHFSWEASLKFHLTAKEWDSGDEDKDVLRVFSCSFHLWTVLRPASVHLRVLRYWSQWLVLKSTMDSATGDSLTSPCQVGGRDPSLSFLEPELPLSVLDTFSTTAACQNIKTIWWQSSSSAFLPHFQTSRQLDWRKGCSSTLTRTWSSLSSLESTASSPRCRTTARRNDPEWCATRSTHNGARRYVVSQMGLCASVPI